MTTTIKVSDETKQLLDMLQAKMTLTFRKKKPLSELIDDITRIALRHEDELLQVKKTPSQAAPKNISRMVKTDAGTMDDYVYVED
ncbi:MAG: hypothetical protein O8C64_00555 [Candidatus Methanoperedens sp.]|nr:hypothetical protein [Candidatus Methanoperedens sp.]MCZ7404148.1 hypothetical protein [Candidatus Methanoperedens sp.]